MIGSEIEADLWVGIVIRALKRWLGESASPEWLRDPQ
jgi:hypothetical protein